MINTPFTRTSLNVQDGVVDCNEPTLSYYSDGNNLFTLGSSAANPVLTISHENVALHVDVDKAGTIPVMVKEQGYEWVPVYTRKLT